MATAGDCWFDADEAMYRIDFFQERLRHVKGAKARELFELEPWEKAIVANLFGWKRPDGLRRYRKAFILIPRKNGKTFLTAGIANICFFGDGEPGAEVYAAAKDRNQAGLLFDVAKQQVLWDPELSSYAGVYRKRIVIEETGSFFEAVSAEDKSKHGMNPHVAIVDELHVQPNARLVDALQSGMGARREPLLIFITTADYQRESVCNEKHDYAIKVRDGVIDDPYFLPVLYQAEPDKGDDWKDREVWKKVNPNLGVSVSWTFLEEEFRLANELPRYENTFKRLYLNIRTGQDVALFHIEDWDKCCTGGERTTARFNEMCAGKMTMAALEKYLKGRRCFAGLDLSASQDLTAFVLAFPEIAGEDQGYWLLPYFWIPEFTAKKDEREKGVTYSQWHREGWIYYSAEETIDYSQVWREIDRLCDLFDIREVGFDPWQARPLVEGFRKRGIEPVEFRQVFSYMNSATRELERLVMSGKIAHGGHPVLRWNASNLNTKENEDGFIRPIKKKNSHAKIDGMVAAIMAIGRAALQPEKKVSVYETRGALTF